MLQEHEEEVLDSLSLDCDAAAKAVAKMRKLADAAAEPRVTAGVVDQLYKAQERATEQVHRTVRAFETTAADPDLTQLTKGTDYVQLKATFKQTVVLYNTCCESAPLQRQGSAISRGGGYRGGGAGSGGGGGGGFGGRGDDDGKGPDDDDDNATYDTDAFQLQVVFDEGEDVNEVIERETRGEAQHLATNTAALVGLMADTVERIEGSGRKLKKAELEVDTATKITEDALKELSDARVLQRKLMKCRIIAVVVGVVAALVLGAVIVIVVCTNSQQACKAATNTT